ncbi:pitrilysin family protein [uncultured Mailhella sp.]|uniref:M16 family metallopeptidase n=1 Tax=uncultured Mailhella sp. TaxID=1981031 RepID=UPI0025EEEDA0|nr:pitrilysin family protein [uncultured Mailhella sp.]
MRFFKFCAGVALAVCLAFGGTGAAQAVSDVQTFRLENGLTVLVREDSRFPLVSVRLFVKAGSAWEKPEEAGMSHLLEHMVFKGSKTSGPGVDKRVENAGGSMNAYTSYDMTTYLTDLPAAKWKDAMTAVRDLAFDPLLRQADLDAEREVVIAEKKQRGDNPMTKLFQTALAHTLKGTPYETPVIGTEEALRGMTPDMMRDYIKRRYDPRDMVLSVAGDVKASDIVAEAKELFGGYENHNVLKVEPSIDPATLAHGMVVDVQPGPWDKAFVSLTFPLPGMKNELMPAVDVLTHLLSGDDTALLPKRYRIDAPVVDSVSASAMSFERAGVFAVLAQLDAVKVADYLRDMGKTLANLKASDFTDEEIARARLNLEDSYLRGLENIANIAETMGAEYFYDPSSVGGERYLAAVRSVGREQIQAAIDTWLRPDALAVSALVPQGENGSSAVVDNDKVRAAMVQGWPETGRATALSSTSADKAAALKPEVVKLGEGRTLVLLPDRSLPYVSAALSFSGGELLATDEEEGLATLAASVLTTGTKNRTLNDINVYLSGRASGLSAGIGLRSFSVQMDAPARFAPEVFSLMKEVLEQPAFRDEDVERAKREQTASIVSSEQSAMGLLGRNLRHFLFGRGSYAHRTEGDPAVVAKYTAKDVEGFWNRQKVRPWVLSVAGDFNRAEVEAFARSLPAPSAKALESSAPSWNGQKSWTMTLPGRNQAVYLMLFPTTGTENADRPALRLLSECLGGFTGKLYQELREKQSLGYSVFPVDWSGKDTGFLAFGIIASPENLDKAKATFEAIVRDLHENLLPEETLARAKAVAEADFYRARQSRAMRAGEGAANILNGHDLDYSRKNLEAMKSVDAKTLRDVARRYLDLNKAYDLRVTPVETPQP